jgi:hypothetical protein
MIRKTRFSHIALTALLLSSPVAYAGPYTDDLSKCLVASTSDQDKTQLVEWIFFSLSLNPKISPYAQVSPAQREVADKGLAKLFERLVAESCSTQTKQAVQYEGTAALSESFRLLGQVAAQEIFKDPAVAAGTSKFAEYLDEKKINQALGLPASSK